MKKASGKPVKSVRKAKRTTSSRKSPKKTIARVRMETLEASPSVGAPFYEPAQEPSRQEQEQLDFETFLQQASPVESKTALGRADSAEAGPGESAATESSQWVELFPSGISVQSNMGRPVLILKDKSGAEVLPVWLHPLDAAVALSELSQGSGLTPHVITRRLFEALQLELESCTFTELIGHHQYVQLGFKTSASHLVLESLRLRADEAMSFCLQTKARFYCTRELMARCRDLDAELGSLEQGLNGGMLPGLRAELEISSKKFPYVM